jgi:hypothetical protein
MSYESQKRQEIMEAYLFLREKNQSIPSDTLELMKDAALESLVSKNESIGLVIGRVYRVFDESVKHRLKSETFTIDGVRHFMSENIETGEGRMVSEKLLHAL